MRRGEIMGKQLLHKDSDGNGREDNCGGELNWEGMFQYHCDTVLKKCGNFLSKTPLNFRQYCKQ